jgi:hypothetical protein
MDFEQSPGEAEGLSPEHLMEEPSGLSWCKDPGAQSLNVLDCGGSIHKSTRRRAPPGLCRSLPCGVQSG